MPKYITTPKGYFLVVLCDLDMSKLATGCAAHSSLENMHKVAAKMHGLELDEVEGNEWYISVDSIVYDDRGCSDGEVLTNVEEYLNTFEL